TDKTGSRHDNVASAVLPGSKRPQRSLRSVSTQTQEAGEVDMEGGDDDVDTREFVLCSPMGGAPPQGRSNALHRVKTVNTVGIELAVQTGGVDRNQVSYTDIVEGGGRRRKARRRRRGQFGAEATASPLPLRQIDQKPEDLHPVIRTPIPGNNGDMLAMIQARVSKNNDLGLQKDMRKAVELFTEAAELGFIDALYSLGVAHDRGEGDQQDYKMAAKFWSKAAMQGHVLSRHNLGCIEGQKGNDDRAVRHYLISAKIGVKESLDAIKKMLMVGEATKEQYVEALKGYQDAVEETKSHDRDEAKRLGH
ncbi:hypothetical protein THAOC_12535, partial [Thalassiosira oceanica]